MGVVLYTMVTGRMPFDDCDMKVLLGHIKRGVSFHKPKQQISEDCKDLIRSMLNLDYRARISIEDIESHCWLASVTSLCTPRAESNQSGRTCSSNEDD